MIKKSIAEVDGIGEVTVRKGSGIRNLRISVSPSRGVVLSVPWLVPVRTALEFLESKKSWVLATIAKQRAAEERSLSKGMVVPPIEDPGEIEAVRRKARSILLPKIEKLAEEHGFTYNRVFIKNNKTNWGSCSVKGNINLNISLIFLPERLQEFVILHELSHLRYPNHGKNFHILVDSLCGGKDKSLSSELRQWRIS